jgi:hypothetical protein
VINFRYHVVSLTAVFLALAIGLVVGTAALNGPVADTLKAQVSALNKDNSNMRDQVNQYRDQVNSTQQFATEIAPTLLNGKLAGRKLLLLALPGSQDYVNPIKSMLTVAGATITAEVTVQDKFFDPNNNTELLDLALKGSQPTIPVTSLPLNSDAVETSSALLALALQQRTPPVDADDVTAVLTAYSEQNYISVGKNPVSGAEATVIVAGAPAVDKDAAKKAQSEVTLAAQFANDKPLVVSGNGVGDGNLISEIRKDPKLVKTISTVDNGSTNQGQVATAMAVVERVVQDRVGQYGISAGATSQVPKAAA